MKNLLWRLGLPRKSAEASITDAIDEAMRDGGDRQSAIDAEEILLDRVKRAYYERTHLQYDAIHAAIACLDDPSAVDSHQWRRRVVEFDDPVG